MAIVVRGFNNDLPREKWQFLIKTFVMLFFLKDTSYRFLKLIKV